MSTYQIRVSLIQIEDERTSIVFASPTAAEFQDMKAAEVGLAAVMDFMQERFRKEWSNGRTTREKA